MPDRNDLTFEQKITLIEENEAGSCYRDLRDKLNISIGAVSNFLERKRKYMSDYETNLSKNMNFLKFFSLNSHTVAIFVVSTKIK
jgi:hypothetical protein